MTLTEQDALADEDRVLLGQEQWPQRHMEVTLHAAHIGGQI